MPGFMTLYTTRAHVFQINTETKTSWLPKGDSAIPISFVVPEPESINSPPNIKDIKIVGTTDEGEKVLDCTISWETCFNKRSQKFVQWPDLSGMVYGLGFNSETDLNVFMETFANLKQKILSAPNNIFPSPTVRQQPEWSRAFQQPHHQQQILNPVAQENDGRAFGPSTISQHSNSIKREQIGANGHGTNGGPSENVRLMSRSQSSTGPPLNKLDVTDANGSSRSVGRTTPELDDSHSAHSEHQIKEQLKYENERLKQALEESSKNESLWQNELMNLRTNNAKLTQALQESKSHVEEWEKELLNLRDWNKELQMKVMTLEKRDGSTENDVDHQAELEYYKGYTNEIQGELKRKDNELETLQKAMLQLEIKSNSVRQNGDSNSDFINNNSDLKQKLDALVAKLESRTQELVEVQKELAQFADKIHESS